MLYFTYSTRGHALTNTYRPKTKSMKGQRSYEAIKLPIHLQCWQVIRI